tara:strand:- start:1246 stop:4188 length:2943 start_codon:yes stop_codon:yes gene_type:complete
VKVSLPVISTIYRDSIKTEIVSQYKTSTGDRVFDYKIYVECSTVDLLNSDVVSVKVTLLPKKSGSPTNDFKKIAGGDLSPISTAISTRFSSLEEVSSSTDGSFEKLESFLGGTSLSEEKLVNFSKNSAISKSILKSHTQLKASIRDNRVKEDQSSFGSDSISVDSAINSDAKKALLKSKMKNAIMSNKGNTISKSASSSDIFFDGGVKFTSIKRSLVSSNTTKPESDIPILDSFLIQKSSPSLRAVTSMSSTSFERDSQGNVIHRSGYLNTSRQTQQDELMGILERSGKGMGPKSSLESDPKSAAWTSALQFSIPPSLLVKMEFSKFINTAKDNYGGLSTSSRQEKDTGSIDEYLKNDDISQIATSLRSSIMTIPRSVPEKVSDMSRSDILTTAYSTTSEKSSFEFQIPVTQSTVSSSGEIILIVEALNTSGRVVQVETKTINHQRNLDSFLVPRLSPEISALRSQDSLVDVSVKQVDSNCNKIIIFKKTLNQSAFSKGSSFKKISDIVITSKDPDHTFSFMSNPGEPLMLRAISISNSGEPGKFRDVVVLPSNSSRHGDLERNFAFATILTQNTSTGIIVESKITSGNLVSYYFVRKNISEGERIFTPISSPSSNKMGTRKNTLQVVDTSTNIGDTYEYKIKFIFKNGSESISEAYGIVKREMVIDSIGVSSLPPTYSKGFKENSYSVVLNSTIDIPQSDADMTRSIFENLDLSDLFDSEISSIKNQFENIAIFHVTRTDVLTGEEYDLGLKTPGEIIDSGDSKSGIPAPTSGEYVYKLEVFVRTPDNILAEVEKSQAFRNLKISRSTPSIASSKFSGQFGTSLNDIEFNYSQKFTAPTAIRDSTLSYGNSIVSNHPESSFEIGKTGIVRTVKVSIPTKDTRVVSKSIRLNSLGDVLIRWSVRGDLSNIDHFIIAGSRSGMIIPVGTHHTYSRGNDFLFTDTSQKGIVGIVSYYIIPVFSDLSQGSRYSAGTISITGEV